ncbi:MAG: hypothetical protein LIQ30_03290 [Planctomycetes bacterium]|nr:hypothetical protein [Planctomycetota bacterium]
MASARNLGESNKVRTKNPVIGVFATHDPRVNPSFWTRGQNIFKLTAYVIVKGVKLPVGDATEVVYTPTLVKG